MVWTGLGILALIEIVGISLRFKFRPGVGSPIWFANLLPYYKVFFQIVLASLAAGAVVGWSRSRKAQSEPMSSYDRRPITWGFVLAHLSAFAAFVCLSQFVFEGDDLSSQLANVWVLSWLASGLLSGVFLLLAAIPASQWLLLFRQGRRFVFVFLLIGGAIMIGNAVRVMGFSFPTDWGDTLRAPTYFVVKWLLEAFGEDLVSDPAEFVLGTEYFTIEIWSSCSGYSGILKMVVLVGIYLWFFRHTLRFPRAFIIFPFAIVAIWIVNALRIASLVVFGTYVSPEIALGGFHSQSGWIGFIAVSLGMMAITQRTAFFARQSDLESRNEKKYKDDQNVTGYLAPFMALLGTMMVTGVFSSGFDWLYPIRFFGTGAVIWLFWRSSFDLFKLAGRFSWEAMGIGAVTFAVWVGMEWTIGEGGTGAAVQESLVEMPIAWSTTWIIFRVLGSVITVPIAEELAFRGYLLRRLVSTDFESLSSPRFTWISFLVSSFLFGVLHGRWVAGTAAGMFYASAMYRRGRVGDAIIAHATTNALIAVYVLVFGEWDFWT